jgi:hypothetical protein
MVQLGASRPGVRRVIDSDAELFSPAAGRRRARLPGAPLRVAGGLTPSRAAAVSDRASPGEWLPVPRRAVLSAASVSQGDREWLAWFRDKFPTHGFNVYAGRWTCFSVGAFAHEASCESPQELLADLERHGHTTRAPLPRLPESA